MRGILRTFGCLNARCGHEFDAWEAAPECPKCRSVKVCWRPRGGHIHGETTKHNDRTLKSLANSFGLTDMGQRGGTRAGEPVKRDLPTPPRTMPYTPAPGFKVPFAENGRPTAGWADSPYPLTGKLPIGTHRFKNERGRIPTSINHRHRDDPRR